MGGRIKRSVTGVPLRGKVILLRADLDVPLVHGTADHEAVKKIVPTLHYLIQRHNTVVVIGHVSRPHGPDSAFSTRPLAKALANALGQPVHFVGAAIGHKAAMAIKRAPLGSIILLENLRFYSGEEQNSDEFARQLALDSGADYFVQDDRRSVRRKLASTVGITQYLPSIAGFNVVDVWDGPGVRFLLDA